MKKKRMLIIGACIALCGLTVVGTYAWMTTHTNQLTNSFVPTDSKNISIELKEENFDKNKAMSYLPGDVITKDPTIKNTSKKESVYVAIKVTYQLVENGQTVNISKEEFKQYAQMKDFGTKWIPIDSTSESELYMYEGEVKANKTIDPALFQSVEINKQITFDQDGNLPAFHFKVEGYATQYRNATIDEARTSLINLSKMGGE